MESVNYMVNSLPLHVLVSDPFGAAEKTCVILVHGFPGSSHATLPIARQLAPHLPVYAPDLPGFGKSAHPVHPLDLPGLADTLVCWMDRAGIGKAHFLGNSFGSQVVTELAVRHVDRVEKVVLASPVVDPRLRTYLQQGSRLLIDLRWERPSTGLKHLRDLLALGLLSSWHVSRVALTYRIEERLPRVPHSALVVHGEHDIASPLEWTAAVAHLLPAGQLAVIPGGPHVLTYSASEALAQVVLPFLRGDANVEVVGS